MVLPATPKLAAILRGAEGHNPVTSIEARFICQSSQLLYVKLGWGPEAAPCPLLQAANMSWAGSVHEQVSM